MTFTGKQLLKDVKDILDKAGIMFWIDCGTLLGAIRDNDFIEWDNDIDISIMAKDRSQIELIEGQFLAKGQYGRWERDVGHKYIASQYLIRDDLKVDIYANWKVGKYLIKPVGDDNLRKIPIEYCEPFKEIDFCGMKVKVPNNPEKYLETLYGNWKKPDKEWTTNKMKKINPNKYSKYLI